MGKDPNDYEHVDDRPGHDLRYAIDSTKIRKRTRLVAKYDDFEARPKDTIEWYKENEAWWKPQKEETEEKYKEMRQLV